MILALTRRGQPVGIFAAKERASLSKNTGKSVCHAGGASCTRFVCTDIIGKSGIKVQSENSFCQIKQESAEISKHTDKVFTGASDTKWPNAQTTNCLQATSIGAVVVSTRL